ncbi:MAG: hypothetical protein ACOYBY_14070 [Dermatophilaceae bacterium]
MTIDDLLALLGPAAVVPAANTPETRNAAFIAPGGPAVTGAITSGALQHAIGGLAQANTRTPLRLVAVVGLGASLRGIARVLLPRVNAAGGAFPLTEAELTFALHTYNAIPLAVGNSAPTPAMPQMTWQVGQQLTLPVEVGPAGSWVTDLARLRQWAVAPPALKQWGLDHGAAPLPIPTPETTTAAVTTLLAGNPTVTTLATTLGTWLLNNPYEHVFDLVELFRQCQKSRQGDVPELVIATCEALAQAGLTLLAWGTGGNVVLRRFWRLLAGNVPAALQARATAVRSLLAGALGLVAIPAGGWQDYTAFGPTVEPTEPPLTATQARAVIVNKTTKKSRTELSAMVLGRVVPVGTEGGYNGWVGPALVGTMDPFDWLARHPAVKTALGPSGHAALGVPIPADKVGERMEVAARIASNEAFLDGCRAQDAAWLSAGMQQWSVHNNEELSVLLERFRVFAEDHYDMFFGVFKLQTRLSGPAWSNLFAPDPTKPSEYFPFLATFLKLDPNEPATEMLVEQKGQPPHPERRAFFGAPAATPHHFCPHWCARVRLAALCSTDYNIVQLQTAAWRFTRIDLNPATSAAQGPTRYQVKWAGFSFTLDTMLSSTYAAALVLDAHINGPSHITGVGVVPADPGDLKRAAERTQGAQPLAAGPPDASWLKRFATNFMAIRRFSDPTAKPTRDRDIHALLDAATDPNAKLSAKARSLSPDTDPASFTGLV